MGPEPIIRILWMSFRRGNLAPLLHQFHELIEEIERIMGSWGSLRMILHAEDRMRAVPEAFQRLIVQVHVGDFALLRVQRIRIDREAVIVRRDFDFTRLEVFHGMIRAAMTELQLVRAPAKRQAEDLLTEADAEDGDAPNQ